MYHIAFFCDYHEVHRKGISFLKEKLRHFLNDDFSGASLLRGEGRQLMTTDMSAQWVCLGSDQAKSLILKELFVYFSLKQCLYRPFWGQKEQYIGRKAYGRVQLRKETESCNALFDAEKCDIGPGGVYGVGPQ